MIGPLTYRSWLLLLATCVVVFGVNLGGARAITEHEMNVAGGARQMLAEGDYVIPRLGDRTWLEKPPSLHWLAALSMKISGRATEWVIRLPSVLAGIGVVLLVATLVGWWMGERAGLVAGLIQCTSLYAVTYARLAEADMLLALNVVAAVVVFVLLQGIGRGHPSPHPRTWAIVFWVLVGLTNLSKGPLFGAAMVLVPALAWLILRRDAAAWRRMLSPLGIPLGIAVAVAWPAAIATREPAAFDLWRAHTFGRVTGEIGYGQSWWYYLWTPVWQLLPWTFATLKGAGPSLKRAWAEPESVDRFMWLWAVLPIVMLSFSHGKHHHYLIHCLPGFTLVTTRGMWVMAKDISDRKKDAMFIARLLVLVLAPAALAATVIVALRQDEYRVDAAVIGGISTVAILLGGLCCLQARPDRVLAVVVLAVVASFVQVHLSVMPKRDTRRPDRDFLVRVEDSVPDGETVLVTGGEQIARLMFYVRTPVVGVWSPEDVAGHLDDAGTFFVVARKRHEPTLEALGVITRLDQSAHTRGEDSPEDRFTLFSVVR